MIAVAVITLIVNGFPVRFDQPPVERAGRIYVPLRGVFERLGASVVFAHGTIDATLGAHTVQVRIGSNAAQVDGVARTLDAPPFVAHARALVPLRFIAQALGASVDYDAAQRAVTIASAPATATPAPSAPSPAPAPSTAAPGATQTPRPARLAPNFIGGLRPYYDERIGGAFAVSGRTRAGSTVRIDAVSSGRFAGGPWTREGAASATAVADERGFFSAALAVPEFGFGVVELHLVSVDANGNTADVRTRARFGR